MGRASLMNTERPAPSLRYPEALMGIARGWAQIGGMMRRFRMVVALALVAAMFMPTAALAQRYPRKVTMGGMDCVEQPGRSGIETWCRYGDEPPFRVNPVTGMRMDPPALQLTRFERPANPTVAAMNLSSQNDGSGRYFAGGFGLGALLGPIGWLIAGLNASNSAVEIPPPSPQWTPHEQTQFAMTYASEVRSSRTTASVLGGITGTIVVTTVIILLINAADDTP